MALNLHHLSIFQAVADAGNVTRAANHLMISQPAVSKQVKLLEQSLGTTLLQRSRRGVQLTEAGQLLAGYANRIQSLSAEAESAIEQMQSLRRGRLSVAASPTIGTYLLPKVLVRFRLKYPGIQLKMEIQQAAVLFDRMASESLIDVALTEMEPSTDPLEFQTFMRDQFIAIAAHRHPLSRKKTVSMAEFAKAGLILRDSTAPGGSFVEQFLRQERIDVKPILRLSSTEAIKEAVAAGLGVGIVSGLAVKSDLALKRLAAISVRGLNIRRPLYQVLRPNRQRPKAVIAFLYMLKHAARGTLPGLDKPIVPAI
jgi:DNA-binding transcriptional LysR family regulator